jgi:hypothetical protein
LAPQRVERGEKRRAPRGLVGEQAVGQRADGQTGGAEAVADKQSVDAGRPAEWRSNAWTNRAKADSGLDDRRPAQPWGDVQSGILNLSYRCPFLERRRAVAFCGIASLRQCRR